MTQEQYERAIEIHKRLGDLESVQKEIGEPSHSRLSYTNETGKEGRYPSIMARIASILDKHDILIRAEIKSEIESLQHEITEL